MHALFASLYLLAGQAKDRLNREDRGATAVEYGLMVGLIAVVIITAVILLGNNLNDLFGDVNTKMVQSTAPTTT